MTAYQNLITQSMYDKQLDSGRGTLLHLCDDVIQQEVSTRIIFYFIDSFPLIMRESLAFRSKKLYFPFLYLWSRERPPFKYEIVY